MAFVDPAVKPQDQQTPPEGEQQQQQTQQQEPEVVRIPRQETEEERQARERPRDPDTGRFTTEDMAKARQQEKDKLYAQIDEMRQEIERVKQERQEREQREAAQRAEQEEAERTKREEEMDVRQLLTQRETEWERRFREMQEERERDKAIFERENAFRAVQDYRTDRLTAEADNIMPELRDLVAGNTQEEIDASIENLKDRTNRILQQVASAQQQQHQQMPGTKVTSPPVGPVEEQAQYETLTPEDIRNMSIAEYSKRRNQLLGAAGQQNKRDRGLMG